ncbi:hypothetical protein [Flavobacterium sp.]|uniref:hypothetical protein n=1 Tax=Flavobacterium sp. TaxID=239 RepID=UPI0039E5AC3D
MQNRTLHIVSFDNPFPPIYGGIIEVFYKLKPLKDLGIAVHLHCFVEEIPTRETELEQLAARVYYYKNSKHPFSFFSWLPFSVQSRDDKTLLKNLQAVDAPILFKGLKTTYLVYRGFLTDRKKLLRLHNIEQDYFGGISKSETRWHKKFVYWAEAIKFKRYEKIIGRFEKVAALSKFENEYINAQFGNSVYVPVFHGNPTVSKLDGVGKYAIYHGDLRMSDNIRVAENLIDIFKKIPDVKLVIASNSNEDHFNNLIGEAANISYVSIENFEHLKQLLEQAHINLIFSYQRSGTKLKLMNSLYYSRFCLINQNIMDDENVSQLCEFANSNEEIINKVNILKNLAFNDYEQRKRVLETEMNDHKNAEILAKIILG